MWDFVMDKSGAGAGFLQELRFPLPIYISFASPQSSSLSPEAGTIGQDGRSANSVTNQIKKMNAHNLIILVAYRCVCVFFLTVSVLQLFRAEAYIEIYVIAQLAE
jgi:hypothetical protein